MIPPYSPNAMRTLMRRHGLTCSATARMAGVSQRTVRKWCAPEGAPTHQAIPANTWRLFLVLTGEVSVAAMRIAALYHSGQESATLQE